MIKYGKILLVEFQAPEVLWAKQELEKYAVPYQTQVDGDEVIIWFEERFALNLPFHLGAYFYRVETMLKAEPAA